MEAELAALKSDVAHIKGDTSDIKKAIDAFIADSRRTAVEMEALRGRIRECEHDCIDAKNALESVRADLKREVEALKKDGAQEAEEIANLRTFAWRLAAGLALVSSGVSFGLERILP